MLEQVVTAVLSSAGLTGGIFAAVVTAAIRKAQKDAERKRNERLKLEILRLEGEERLSALLFAMLRHSRGGSEKELFEAEKAYVEYLESSNKLKNEIIGVHTSD